MGDRQVTILGIDPGIANLGWGVLRGPFVWHGCITNVNVTDQRPAALNRTRHLLIELFKRYSPMIVALEDTFLTANSAMKPIVMAQGIVEELAYEFGCRLVITAPKVMKGGVTGLSQKSYSTKDMKFAVSNQLGIPIKSLKTPHETDALGHAIYVQRMEAMNG